MNTPTNRLIRASLLSLPLILAADAIAQSPTFRADQPQLRLPAARVQQVDVLASVSLNGGAGSVVIPDNVSIVPTFVAGVRHPFGLTQPTSARFSAFADFRDASWVPFSPSLRFDWARMNLQAGRCANGNSGRLVVHYQVRYHELQFQRTPGLPGKPAPQPAPGSGLPDRNGPSREGLPPRGDRPTFVAAPQVAESNVVSDDICALLPG
jgi:hypothetical protein